MNRLHASVLRVIRALSTADDPDGWSWADERLQRMDDEARLAKRITERGYLYTRLYDRPTTPDGRKLSRVLVPLAQGAIIFAVTFLFFFWLAS